MRRGWVMPIFLFVQNLPRGTTGEPGGFSGTGFAGNDNNL